MLRVLEVSPRRCPRLRCVDTGRVRRWPFRQRRRFGSSASRAALSAHSAEGKQHGARGVDVAIIGGGPCGLLAAYALMAEHDVVRKITLIESRPRPGKPSVGGGARNYQLGINAMGQSALKKIDGGREDGH